MMARPLPVVSADPAAQAHYELCLANGCAPALAEMLALRRFPGIAGTDAVFNQGRKLDGSQFEEAAAGVGAMYLAKAKAAGVNPAGKYYCGGLARFPGDPRAWIDSRGDVARICAESGWTAEGAVKVEAPKYADGYVPPETYAVDPALIDREVDDRVAAEPGLASGRDELAAGLAATRAGVYGR